MLVVLIGIEVRYHNIVQYFQVNNISQYLSDHKHTMFTNPEIKNITASREMIPTTLTYGDMLARCASSENVIILTLVDSGFVDMAMNFYETSILKHNISNYLFVSLSTAACENMIANNINCFTYYNFGGGKQESSYMQKFFLKKMALRIEFVFEALKLGYSLIFTDIDVIFMQDPRPDLLKNKHYEIQAMQDMQNYINAGFFWVKTSKKTINIFEKLMTHLKHNPSAEDQRVLNGLVNGAKKNDNTFQCLYLNTKIYMNGLACFELPKIKYFADLVPACSTCIVCHNNWIVSKAAKIYRFKEMHMWVIDENGYYSSHTRKYMTYQNPLSRGIHFPEQQKALHNALAIAHILNRTLILPRFICSGQPCALNSHILIDKFDKQFAGRYRENTFLSHPKVPKEISQQKTHICQIDNGQVNSTNSKKDIKLYYSNNTHQGVSDAQIQMWFSEFRNITVLQLGSMLDVGVYFKNDTQNMIFTEKCIKAFMKSDYRQLTYMHVKH